MPLTEPHEDLPLPCLLPSDALKENHLNDHAAKQKTTMVCVFSYTAVIKKS